MDGRLHASWWYDTHVRACLRAAHTQTHVQHVDMKAHCPCASTHTRTVASRAHEHAHQHARAGRHTSTRTNTHTQSQLVLDEEAIARAVRSAWAVGMTPVTAEEKPSSGAGAAEEL